MPVITVTGPVRVEMPKKRTCTSARGAMLPRVDVPNVVGWALDMEVMTKNREVVTILVAEAFVVVAGLIKAVTDLVKKIKTTSPRP